MNLSKSIIKLNGVNKNVVVANIKNDENTQQTTTKTVNQLHHIHILDRSGSMSRDIDELIENVKQTIDYMDDNDFVTIIWFASEGQFATLVKAAKKDESIKLLLDSIKSTLGCTCFSDPLKEVKKVIDETSIICDNFNITLFTDGEPVTSWSEAEEEMKIFEALREYADKVIAINTIGYGNFYNKKLLTIIANSSEFGEHIHSSKIDEYMSIFSHNYERISDLYIQKTKISKINTTIIYLNSSSAKMYEDVLEMKMMEKKKNQFIIINKDANDFDFEINGEILNSKDIKTNTKAATELNIKYVYAYLNYYNDNRKVALNVLSDIGDKYLVDMQMNAFTIDEVAKYTKELKKCVFKPKYRFKDGKCVKDYLPAPDTFCVLDLLKLLSNNNAKYVYTQNYKRIGLKTEDSFNLFKWDNKLHTTEMKDIIFNEKELNISLRNKITGTVKINPIAAKKVNLPENIPSYIYRSQTLIKDGQLNINEIKVIIDEETLNKIKDKEILVINSVEEYEDKYLVELNLTTIPVINQMYLNDKLLNANYILDIVMDNNKDIIDKKILSHFYSLIDDKSYNSKYNNEQIEILKEHGIDKDGMYSGVKVITAEKNEEDYYLTRSLIFNIKGDANLPSVNSVLKLSKEPTKGMKKYLYDRYNEYAKRINEIEDLKDRKEFINKNIKQLNAKILNNKFNINASKISCILTGNWYSNLTKNDKNEYEYSDGINTLIVKTDKVKKYF